MNIASYNIYRDANLSDLAGSTSGAAFEDHQRDPGTTYFYFVQPINVFGFAGTVSSITVHN